MGSSGQTTQAAETEQTAKIRFVEVTKTYPGSARGAVESVSFEVRPGAICMLVGTSGSGKTTLLRMVNRLIDPTSGETTLTWLIGIYAILYGATLLYYGYRLQALRNEVRAISGNLGQTRTASQG